MLGLLAYNNILRSGPDQLNILEIWNRCWHFGVIIFCNRAQIEAGIKFAASIIVILLSSMILMGLWIWKILIRHHFLQTMHGNNFSLLVSNTLKMKEKLINSTLRLEFGWNESWYPREVSGMEKICIKTQSRLTISNIVLESWF